MRSLPRLRLAAAALLLLAVPLPGAADAVSRNYQVRDDDAARIAVAEFQRHQSRGEWRAAIEELRKLLDLPPRRGVLVSVPGSEPQRYESAWRAAVRLFESMPPEGRAAWEETERKPAEDLLARGVRLRRPDDLAAVARRFPARDLRRRAHDALAHLALARGDFDRAARELSSLLEVTEPDAQAPVFARLLFAQSQSGDVEGTERTVRLAKPSLAQTVPAPWGPTPLADFAEKMRERAAASAGRFSSVRTFGGDRHGSGRSDPPPRAESPGWTVGTDYRRGEEGDDFYGGGYSTEGSFRPVVPVIAQGAVLVNDGLALTARDVASGRSLWQVRTLQREAAWREHPNAYSTTTVADGVAYAALATRSDAPDIERRFYGRVIIHALPHRALHAVDVRTGEVIWAHDTARIQGRPDAEEVDRESVASPPLVVGEDVYVLTWAFNTRYEARLVCFDRRSGATRWRTSLVHGQQEMNLFGRPVKELVVPPLAELDGLVYASTGLGLAAAVDRVTGDVAWLTEYETTEIPVTYQWHETRDREVTWRPSPTAATRRAVVMAPLESPNLTAFDPRTGALLWKRPWRTSSGASTWFLGVADERAYVLGSRLQAYDVATGRELWTKPEAGRLAPVPSRPLPALGSGLLTSEGVYVPTNAGIARLDAQDGSVLEVRALPAPPDEVRRRSRLDGNLVAADGALVVASERLLDVYYRFEDLAARISRRLQANPEDPRLRLEAGDVFRTAGRLDEAIESFGRGLAAATKAGAGGAAGADRTEASLRRALVDALLARARVRRATTDGPGAWTDLQRAADEAREPADAVRSLFALAECAAETGRDAAADAALQRIANEFADVQTTVDGDARADAGALAAYLRARRLADRGDLPGAVDAWMTLLETRPDASLGETSVGGAVRGALDALGAERGDEVARIVSARGRRSLDAARAAGDVVALHRLARTSPADDVAAEAALAAAKLHLGAGRAREAAAVLEGQVVRPQPEETLARSLWALADAYRALSETPRERGALRRIAQECPAAKLDDGRGAADAARRELAAERFRDTPPSLSDPRPPLAKAWEVLGGTDQPAMQLLQVQGTRPRALDENLLFLQGGSEGVLKLVDGATGGDVWTAASAVEVRATFGTTSSVVLVGEDAQIRPRMVRVDGVRASDGTRAWTRRLAGRYAASASALGVVYVLRFDTDDRGERVAWMSAVSADSGDVIAERRLGDKVHPAIACAADAVVYAELIPQGSVAKRRVTTLDGATLAPRGVVEIEGHASPFLLNPPGSGLIVTGARHDGVVAVDTTTGSFAWPAFAVRGRAVKNVLVVPGGVIVTDDGDQVRRIDAATGKEAWVRPLGGQASLGYLGEAAEGDLVVATLVPTAGTGSAEAVGIDAASGDVRWRTQLAFEGRALPQPEVLQGVVAYELRARTKEGYDCRVELLSRADGRIVDTIRHPHIGSFLERAFFHGPYLVLWAPPRADVAVYRGAGSAK